MEVQHLKSGESTQIYIGKKEGEVEGKDFYLKI